MHVTFPKFKMGEEVVREIAEPLSYGVYAYYYNYYYYYYYYIVIIIIIIIIIITIILILIVFNLVFQLCGVCT